jgi:disulfide oxidoreductase YuzD
MQYATGTMVKRMCQEFLEWLDIGQAKESERGEVKIEIIRHNDYYYWLVQYSSGMAIEGYARTLKNALKDIANETNV